MALSDCEACWETPCGCARIDLEEEVMPVKNQCDGCQAGIYKDVQGMHRDEEGNPVMVCQEHKYT